MTRFDFELSDNDQVSHKHDRCYRCGLWKAIAEFGAVGRCGVCNNPHSDHYGHVIVQNHCVCSHVVARQGEEDRFGWNPNTTLPDKVHDDEVSAREDSPITINIETEL